MREATLTAVRFPDPLVLQQDGRGTARALALVDDPIVDRLRRGDGTFGWAGDSRLALYVDVPGGEWILVRLEHDGVYRDTNRWSFDDYTGTDIIPAIIVWLVAHDHRSGWDPLAAVIAANEARDAASRAVHDEATYETAERIVHSMGKNGLT